MSSVKKHSSLRMPRLGVQLPCYLYLCSGPITSQLGLRDVWVECFLHPGGGIKEYSQNIIYHKTLMTTDRGPQARTLSTGGARH